MSEEIREKLIEPEDFDSSEYESLALHLSPSSFPKEQDREFKINHDLEKILNLLFHLERTFEEKIKLDTLKEKMFNSFFQELDFFKEDFFQKTQQPLHRDLAQFAIHFQQVQQIYQQQIPLEVAQQFQMLSQELYNLFQRYQISLSTNR